MKILKHIPNALTAGNILSGSIGLVMVMKGDIYTAAVFILIGSIFDFFDGFAARLVKASSDLGKELDSLADMVTFSLLPSFIIFQLLSLHYSNFVPYLAFLITVSSAYRLAKFNLDTKQNEHFYGMPTPANAFLIAGLVFFIEANVLSFNSFLQDPVFLIALIFISSFLLNAPLWFISFKISKKGIAGNEFRILLLIVSMAFIIVFRIAGIFPALIFYVMISLIQNFIKRE